MQGGEQWKKLELEIQDMTLMLLQGDLMPVDELGEIAVVDKHISTFFIVGHMCRHWIIHTTDSFYFFHFLFNLAYRHVAYLGSFTSFLIYVC